MYSVILALLASVSAGAGTYYGVDSVGWGVTASVLTFIVFQLVLGLQLQKRVKAAMTAVQAVLVEGQKQMQAKMQRWQLRPPGSIQEAQLEMARDQKVLVKQALELTKNLEKFIGWVPMMKRQIATARYQLNWMIKDFAKVDELAKDALFIEPVSKSMNIARMYMKGEPMEKIGKAYSKAVKRGKYNDNVLPTAAYTWILMQKNEVDKAFAVLTEALKNSDNEVLKNNHTVLMNNRPAHFTNAGLGDQWYSLFLEEPRMRQQRQRMQWR